MKEIDALKPGEMGKRYRVGTFPVPRGDGSPSTRFNAYTLWYNAAWEGCVEYEVIAPDGRTAKRAAIRLRQGKEPR